MRTHFESEDRRCQERSDENRPGEHRRVLFGMPVGLVGMVVRGDLASRVACRGNGGFHARDSIRAADVAHGCSTACKVHPSVHYARHLSQRLLDPRDAGRAGHAPYSQIESEMLVCSLAVGHWNLLDHRSG